MLQKIILLALLAFQIVLNSCSKDPDTVITGKNGSFLSGSGAFILNEGNFRSGNGSLSFFSYDSARVYNNIFSDLNQKSLGDVPYSMDIINNKAYVLVNNSGRIEVINSKTAKSLTTIKKIDSPRYISFISPAKAYVTSLYSDSLTIINLVKDEVSGHLYLKHTSESIVSVNSKAYVANWSGGNKIFIIDTYDDQVIDSIAVGTEPESMVLDKNEVLWVLSNGGWQREHFAELNAINTQTDMIIRSFTFPSVSDSPVCLQVDGRGENLYYINGGVFKMSIDALQLPGNPIIPGGSGNFYKLAVNPENNEIFVTDVMDYQQKGSVLRYNRNGSLIAKMEADIIPGYICFRPNSTLTE